MATFVVAHGAWSAGWAWKKMHPLMAARGHRLFTPSYTGLGERAHLGGPHIDLETHIADIVGVLEMEDLRGVILIGHSYGGMVATGVADRARDRIAQLVYLDSFAPKHGDSVFSLLPAREAPARAAAAKTGDGWKMPENPMPPDTPEADRAWAEPRRRPQPLKTYEQRLNLKGGELTLPRHYIYALRHPPDDRFRPFLERGKREGWRTYEIDASHNPHITCPDVLMKLLDEIAAAAPVRQAVPA
jgi:pimeloyl-ACP methyl ester carboxylesterase